MREVGLVFGMSLLVILSLQTLNSCSSTAKKVQSASVPSVTVMAYNVENLFDTIHDEGKDDDTYLPLEKKQSSQHKRKCMKMRSSRYQDECLNLDWSEKTLQRKMERVADAVEQFNGKGPDILMLEEVENLHVLKQLNDNYLKKSGYETVVLLEGQDPRGIDPALLSRLPLAGEPKLHVIPFVLKENEGDKNKKDEDESDYSPKDTRGILQVDLRLPDEEILTVFVAHLPSSSNPRYLREQAIDFLAKLKSELPAGRMAIAGGDFNVVKKEEDKYGLIEERIGKNWLVSHLIGCKDCKGTNYYSRERAWSFLDLLLFHPDMGPQGSSSWEVLPSSIRIPTASLYQVSNYLTPARFDDGRGSRGVTDHWPIFAVLQKRATEPTPQ